MKRLFPVALPLMVFLVACSSETEVPLLRVAVQPAPFVISIPAVGELESVTATPITAPNDVFEPQILAWIVEENTLVKAGDVVARFDDVRYRREADTEALRQQQVIAALDSKQFALGNERRDIFSERQLVGRELEFAAKFAVDDLRVYSRNEIIDKMANVDYLNAKNSYQGWRTQRQELKAQTETGLLLSQKQQHDTKLGNFQHALSRMEVRAPHDGVFVLESNWSGKKTRVGETLWPGRKFATIPDLSKMQARIFVLESEAAGLAAGLKVRLQLDAWPQRSFEGVISQVDALASPRKENNPVKYFAATVTLKDADPAIMRPGARLKADVIVAEHAAALTVPMQAVVRDAGETRLWVLDDDEPVQRTVTLGARSPTRVVVESGLQAGDQVLLQPPAAAQDANAGDQIDAGSQKPAAGHDKVARAS